MAIIVKMIRNKVEIGRSLVVYCREWIRNLVVIMKLRSLHIRLYKD